ncbi:SRPBCC family protein [Agaribacter marinus]|uniref:Polyketide cyclase / dehydrase and lipid transport n=1 Tax=Agaribacter marinus TaxID=1431249 RepID=A0AA37SXP7_9ALTE|nr:SRPBCC family protein [Agaribacter marinus]GLR70454.1 hypothetical protein GCM10007852_13620 [Agaribacter marinus]
MKTLSVTAEVNAPLSIVWQVVADVYNYHLYAPNITESVYVRGDGVNSVRKCSSKEGSWLEVCTNWSNLDSYSYKVLTEGDNYPYPFKALDATWKTVEISSGKVEINLTINISFKYKLMEFFVYPLMKRKYQSICDQLMVNWQRECHKKLTEAA